ncbi:MAG: MgtC/SapB family protein [Dehalococcoidia bacterium]
MTYGDQFEMVGRLLLAVLLGAAIGIEREYRGHEAGVRTSALVCGGAALFGETSVLYGDSRVAAGVVQGIGFLGAGLIFQRGHDVRGVTTAATVWVLAGIGLAVAENMWLTAVLITAMVVVLLELSPLSDMIYRFGLERHGDPNRSRRDEAREDTGNPQGPFEGEG